MPLGTTPANARRLIEAAVHEAFEAHAADSGATEVFVVDVTLSKLALADAERIAAKRAESQRRWHAKDPERARALNLAARRRCDAKKGGGT